VNCFDERQRRNDHDHDDRYPKTVNERDQSPPPSSTSMDNHRFVCNI
jgi:hypothetical protein